MEGVQMSIKGDTRQKTKSQVKEPKRYSVIMHNDDYTPMDFVVQVLVQIFNKGQQEAVILMMTVHKGGKAVVGTYPYDIAMTKIRIVTSLAEQEGYPFRLSAEEV